MKTNKQNLFFLAAFVTLFAVFYGLSILTAMFDWTWTRILICLVVVSGVTAAWSVLKKISAARSFRAAGFGFPDLRVIGVVVILSSLMLAFFPLYARLANVTLPLQTNWPWILLGIVTGVGITEETLFRGYVFSFLREKRNFMQAATLSMVLFGAMHLLLFLWLPLPLAIAAILLSVIAAYPSAYLFETSNRTIWPSAIMHSTALTTNLFVIPPEISPALSMVWIGVVTTGLFLAFFAAKLILKQQVRT